jgi:hypothetical protein
MGRRAVSCRSVLGDPVRGRVQTAIARPTVGASWNKDGEGKPLDPEVGIWERRFIRAELEFTGDPDEGLAEIDETRGHNIFLKIYSEGWILDLTSYV